MARPRKPTVLHLVQGTARVGRHNPTAEPTPMRGIPDAPEYLTRMAAEAWRRLTPVLDTMGVLTIADAFALERLCECYSEIRQHAESVELEGPTYQTKTVTGEHMTKANPAVAMRADADRRFAMYLGQFGLTPAARTKVSMTDGKQADPLERYFTG